jgi:hypothetical protein
MREPRRSTEAAGLVGSTEEPRGNTEEPRRTSTKARPKVSCGAPSRRRGAEEELRSEAGEPRTAAAKEGIKAAGFVQSTEEPRESTEARPKVLCGALSQRRSGEEPRRSTKARPKNRGPPRPRKGPSRSTAAAEEYNQGGASPRNGAKE